MKYLSLCSGIEAATVAWHPLGWTPVAFSEIDPFPCAVLAHHYPDVPNWGDMTRFKEWPDATIDLLVGGTPCQSFSVAGLRAGLDDPRGNLALVYLAVADRYRPKWLVWENVPGVLSSDEGRAMGSILGAMAKLGYGFAYRVLDAQYVRVDGFGRAVPQRRRRVFVVGCLGDWRAAAAVLFERESLSGNPAPRREAGEGVTGSLTARSARNGGPANDDVDGHRLIPVGPGGEEISHAVSARDRKGPCSNLAQGTLVAHSVCLGSDPIYNREVAMPQTGRNGDPGVVAFDTAQITSKTNRSNPQPGDPCHTLHQGSTHHVAVQGANQQDQFVPKGGVSPTLAHSSNAHGGHHQPKLWDGYAVRRLTPREAERLQGLPDDYTLIEYRGKPAKDGPRYKALGNSMAVNVMRWLGRRVQMVEAVMEDAA